MCVNCSLQPEESLSDDFLFPMSSLRLSYASSPESDLEHSPGPPSGLNANLTVAGRLTKASSDPSVVMPDSSTTDVLPPYQVIKLYLNVITGKKKRKSTSENIDFG